MLFQVAFRGVGHEFLCKHKGDKCLLNSEVPEAHDLVKCVPLFRLFMAKLVALRHCLLMILRLLRLHLCTAKWPRYQLTVFLESSGKTLENQLACIQVYSPYGEASIISKLTTRGVPKVMSNNFL